MVEGILKGKDVTGDLGQRPDCDIQQIRSSHSPQKPNRKGNGKKHERNFNQCNYIGKTRGPMFLALSSKACQ